MFKLLLNFNKETETFYITINDLDLYILIEKLDLIEWYTEIVVRNGGEVTKSGEDFFMEEEAYDALEEIEYAFDEGNILKTAIIKIYEQLKCLKKLSHYLTMFESNDLELIIKKSLPN